MEATQSQVRTALGLTAQWHEAPSLDALPGIVLPGLHELMDVDATGWNDMNLVAGTLDLVVEPVEAYYDDVDVLQALIEEHPLVPYVVARPASPPLAFSDVVSRRELERRQIYQDFFRPHEIRDLMAFVFSVEPFLAIAMTRSRGDFTPAQRDLSSLVRPHLRSAYRSIAQLERAARRLEALEQGLEERAGGVVLLAGDERIEHTSPRARRLLTDWFAAGGRDRLPYALAGLRGTRAFKRPGARLTVSRVETDPPLLLLDEVRLQPDPGWLRQHGLTPREAKVVACAAHGLSDQQIAEELVVSPRTVQKHLEHVYRKLGVNGRAAAAAIVLGRDQRELFVPTIGQATVSALSVSLDSATAPPASAVATTGSVPVQRGPVNCSVTRRPARSSPTVLVGTTGTPPTLRLTSKPRAAERPALRTVTS
jgi:DNA-binding CsgD family transcriptional regulator